MGITIKTYSKCFCCPCKEIEVLGDKKSEYLMQCGNQELCDHIEKFLRRQLDAEEEGET